ncbi:MAG: hypothetical protein HY313_00220 [Acidobacteria bacterium]|nr:hypothetical protein [Acidobacteriota bacterium]
MKEFKTRKLRLQDIYLDNENARHEPIDSEPEIIAELLSKGKVKALAAHIAKTEATSPLDRVGVFPHPIVKSAFVAGEGNRRLCALKLLNDPDKAPDSHRAYFRSLSNSMSAKPKEIEAVIFDDRAAVRPWIELRHEGPQNGVGTVSWDPRAKARHNRGAAKPTNPNLLAVSVAEYAHKRGLITKSEHDGLNVTTLTRYLSNPTFRNVFGLASPKELSIVVDQAEFDSAIGRFLKDSLKGEDGGVNSRSNATQRTKYARRLQKEKVAPTTFFEDPVPLDPATGSGPQSRGKAPGRRNSSNPDHRRHVIQPPFAAKITNKVLARIYFELREVDCQSHPLAAACLLRAMIEVLIKLFCKQEGIGTNGIKVNVLCGKVCDKLLADDPTLRKQRLKPMRIMANDEHGLASHDTLSSFIHGGSIPDGRYINRTWDSIEDCIGLILSKLK